MDIEREIEYLHRRVSSVSNVTNIISNAILTITQFHTAKLNDYNTQEGTMYHQTLRDLMTQLNNCNAEVTALEVAFKDILEPTGEKP